MKKFFSLCLLSFTVLAFGQPAMRVVDTLADLDQLYPNIEQPTALVRGRLVRDDISPPRIYFWNPDSAAATNDSIRPVRMGIGRWIYSTNATFIGSMIIGDPSLQTAAIFKGFSVGASGIKMERSGVGTNGIGIAGGTVNFWRDDPGVRRMIASFVEDITSASIHLGGNGYSGYTAGRDGFVFAGGVDLTTTNENKIGGDLFLYSGPGSGSGTPSRIAFYVPGTNTTSSTTAQNFYSLFQIQHPQTPNLTNNTGLKVTYYRDIGGTNYLVTARMVLTNESGKLRDYWIEE